MFAALGLIYVLALFVVATIADRRAKGAGQVRPARPYIYALSIAVYCTAWTYFGSVGLAAQTGFDFIPVYLGPILVFLFGTPLLMHVAEVCRRQKVASISDFLSARYGKSKRIAAIVAIISLVALVPYISIQLKALTFSLGTIFSPHTKFDFALPVTVALAAFTILFGARNVDTTQHQHGLTAAIAASSIVKLVTFLIVGLVLTFGMAGGFQNLDELAASSLRATDVFSQSPIGERWLAITLISAFAILLLPQQFSMTFVENAHHREIRHARWLVPAYLVLINLFVIPIAIYGMNRLPMADMDTLVLAVPIAEANRLLTLIAFIGGVSAATAMVIVEAMALALMLTNNVIIPLLAKYTPQTGAYEGQPINLLIRRYLILGILALAYVYYLTASNFAALSETGFMSFAALAQFAPAFIAALIWTRATARGVAAGIIGGFLVWAYTLLLPSFVNSGWLSESILTNGPFGISALRPRQLFQLAFDPLTHGVVWSLVVNVVLMVVVSFTRAPKRIELQQALAFKLHDETHASRVSYPMWRSSITHTEFDEAISRYVGKERMQQSMQQHFADRGVAVNAEDEIDLQGFHHGEKLLATAIGPASSRLVLGLLIERNARSPSGGTPLRLLDDAIAAVSYSRELLQAAIDNVPNGIAVFDNEGALSCFNGPFLDMLGLDHKDAHHGSSLDEICTRIGLAPENFAKPGKIIQFRAPNHHVEARSNTMPDGGLVITFSDATEAVASADAMRSTNELLERRVSERTSELVALNADLQRAKTTAEQANVDKTRFIASASHDILQPLNAARLFTTALVESTPTDAPTNQHKIVTNLNSSLESVEDILSTVLDMAKLDAGVVVPNIGPVRLQDIFDAIEREYQSQARDKGLRLKFMPTNATVTSDRKLLRRIVQNLVSNAIKYSERGHVLVGGRRRKSALEIQVLDTGIGIPESKQKLIFKEFERLGRDSSTNVPGLGLGLSIVERMCRIMGHTISVASVEGKGTRFSVLLRVSGVEAPSPQVSRPAVQSGLAHNLADLRVLVVDDDAVITEGLAMVLSRWGIAVMTAHSREEAIGLTAQWKDDLDVIISDFHMAQEDGLTLIERLRQICGWPVPAVLSTADRSNTVQTEAKSHNVSYLAKPIKPAALRGLLSHFAGARHVAE